jgi:hypothetical protein
VVSDKTKKARLSFKAFRAEFQELYSKADTSGAIRVESNEINMVRGDQGRFASHEDVRELSRKVELLLSVRGGFPSPQSFQSNCYACGQFGHILRQCQNDPFRIMGGRRARGGFRAPFSGQANYGFQEFRYVGSPTHGGPGVHHSVRIKVTNRETRSNRIRSDSATPRL